MAISRADDGLGVLSPLSCPTKIERDSPCRSRVAGLWLVLKNVYICNEQMTWRSNKKSTLEMGKIG